MRNFAGGAFAVAVSIATFAWAVQASETATVTVHVPLHPVAAATTLTGDRGSGQVPTRYVTAKVTESLRRVSSPMTVSTYATGYVVFVSTNPCTKLCYGEFQLPVGFDVATPAGVHYATQAEADFPLLGSSRLIPIKADVPGPSGNASAGTVSVNSNPYLLVSNPQPVTGGSNRIAPVVQQQDYDSALADLSGAIASDVTMVLRAQAPSMLFVPAGSSATTVTSDHAIGDETPTFTLTETLSVAVNAYSDTRVRQLLKANLVTTLPRGEVLAPWSLRTDYTLTTMTDAGELMVVGWAGGDATPAVDSRTMRALIAGRSADQAAAILHAWYPGSTVEIHGWLPADPDRIKLQIVGT